MKQSRKGQSLPKWMEALCYTLTAVGLLGMGVAIFLFFSGQSVKKPVSPAPQKSSFFVASHPVNDATLNEVTALMKGKFRVGDWRFTGVEQHKDRVRAFILIPALLQFESDKQHHQYVRNAVCPAKNNLLWDKLAPQQLEIHLYTSVKNSAEVTRCA